MEKEPTSVSGKKSKKRGIVGRPVIFKDSVSFEIKMLSSDLKKKIDEKRGKKTRRAYLEELLRSHPELQ